MELSTHEKYMKEALIEARKAFDADEVPIGAVIVKDDVIIARGHNRRETDRDPTAHAEMVAMRHAAGYLGGWRLLGCGIYVTIEPCPMCAGAAIQARLNMICYGAEDPKAGCCGTFYNLPEDDRFNHNAKVISGILRGECAEIMKEYFADKRKKSG